jgi:uncharacterized membrane protein YoaK (UPF0700 family)
VFRHTGKTRTIRHNLSIASLLSFVAGMVNIAGFLAVQRLTTNVTGHFAFFIDEVFKRSLGPAIEYFLFIFFFFFGAFISGLLVEIQLRKNRNNIYILPVAMEIAILFSVAAFGDRFIKDFSAAIAFSLLFAMGLQNSLVTTISAATVRTTHLTGLFTDLGIELSQLFFYKLPQQKIKLHGVIKLRLTIISSFFTGGILGGVLYGKMHLRVLLIACILLISGLIFDHLKVRVRLLKRKLLH